MSNFPTFFPKNYADLLPLSFRKSWELNKHIWFLLDSFFIAGTNLYLVALIMPPWQILIENGWMWR